MAQEFAKKFYHSKQWLDCRHVMMVIAHGLCQQCGDPADVVHHIVWLTPENITDPMITLHPDNLVCLCHECHNQIHHVSDVVDDGLVFDENGDLIKKGEW